MTTTLDTAKKLQNNLNKNCAERIAYQIEKQSELVVTSLINHANLDRTTFKTKLSEAFFQKLLDSNSVKSFDFINNHAKQNARFNIKAIKKAFELLHSVVSDNIKYADKYDVAVTLHCIMNRHKDSFEFTRNHALSMLSNAAKFENVSRSNFEMKFDVDLSTASTQVSSTFRILQAIDVLKFDEMSKERAVISDVNYDHAFVKLIAAKFDIDLTAAQTSNATA